MNRTAAQKEYRVRGESREVGAIGLHAPFSIYVNAESRTDAYKQAQARMYAANREHVHIREIDFERVTPEDIP